MNQRTHKTAEDGPPLLVGMWCLEGLPEGCGTGCLTTGVVAFSLGGTGYLILGQHPVVGVTAVAAFCLGIYLAAHRPPTQTYRVSTFTKAMREDISELKNCHTPPFFSMEFDGVLYIEDTDLYSGENRSDADAIGRECAQSLYVPFKAQRI